MKPFRRWAVTLVAPAVAARGGATPGFLDIAMEAP